MQTCHCAQHLPRYLCLYCGCEEVRRCRQGGLQILSKPLRDCAQLQAAGSISNRCLYTQDPAWVLKAAGEACAKRVLCAKLLAGDSAEAYLCVYMYAHQGTHAGDRVLACARRLLTLGRLDRLEQRSPR